MKIGLITYHYSQNYGAVMQTYATCRALKELGHEVEIVNIRQEEKRKLRHIAFLPKYKWFDRFMERFYPPQTSLVTSLEELKESNFDYDCLLVGSDQVWNPMISGDKCLAYFLFFGNSKMKRISYASSFGISQWPKEKEYLIKDIENALRSFDSVSVREITGQVLLKNVFNVDSQVVVDPTMLHSGYDEIIENIPQSDRVVCYLLNRTQEQLKAARFISKDVGCKARILTSVYPILGLEYVYPPSIENWIKHIGGAKFVITDSFHGAVFSLLYKRNFIVFAVNNGRNSRLLDLLKSVGLENRYFTSLLDLKNSDVYKNDIDYSKVTPLIETQRIESLNFLKNSLK